MNWLNLWEEIAKNQENLFQQVGRTSRKGEMNETVLVKIADYLQNQLSLQSQDRLLDVCCGNGMLTVLLSEKCAETTGVDFSNALIETASTHFANDKTHYLSGDALRLSEILEGEKYDKILLYFSFQYFDTFEKGKQVISEMSRLLKPQGVIWIGDVPDYDRYGNHYRTIREKMRFHYAYFTGKNLIGKFWKQKEMAKIADSLSLSLERIMQPEDLPYAHYRSDYCLRKKG